MSLICRQGRGNLTIQLNLPAADTRVSRLERSWPEILRESDVTRSVRWWVVTRPTILRCPSRLHGWLSVKVAKGKYRL